MGRTQKAVEKKGDNNNNRESISTKIEEGMTWLI
jgi:hypothetical protein